MGNNKAALMLIIQRLGDIERVRIFSLHVIVPSLSS
jgi:hypothetical protein